MDRDLIFLLKIIGIVIIMTSIVSIPILYIGSKIQCKSSYSSYEPQFGFFSGCRIQYDGKLTPVDMIKNINLK